MSSRVRTWLAIGPSPTSWQREMAHSTAWVNALHCAYSWTKELMALQHTLHDEPLLGQSLTLLTTEMTRQAQNPSEAVRSTRARPARIQDSVKHELPFAHKNNMRPRKSKTDSTALRSTAVSALTRFPSETPSRSKKLRWVRWAASTDYAKLDWLTQVDRQVDGSQLHQWVKETPMGLTAVPAQRRPWVPVRSTPTMDDVATPQAGSLIAGTLRTDGRKERAFSSPSWQGSLIEQTRRMLHHAYQATTMNPEYQSMIMHTGQEELLLPRQWATTIGEPTATLELLQHYAALSKENGRVANGNVRKENSTLTSLTQESQIPAKLNTVGNVNDHAEIRQPGNTHALAQFLEGGDSINPQTEQRHTEDVQRAGDYVEQIMPPTVASLLPPLATAQRIDKPPLPIAMATARIGARAEMVIEEDLDMLAAKIKRILDDEARRHGIDV